MIGLEPLAWIFLENQVSRCSAGRTFLLVGFGSQTRKHGCMPGATNGPWGLRAKLLQRWGVVMGELGATTAISWVALSAGLPVEKVEAPAAPTAKG